MKLRCLVGFALSLAVATATIIPDDVPDPNDSAVKRHLVARSAMITLEKRQRQDHEFRQNLSVVVRQADVIVQAIRQEEIEDYWRQAGTPERPEDERFAGEMFPLARPYINATKLWQIVKRMPKGALLHAHLSAMLPYDTILETIIETEGMVISTSQPILDERSAENATVTFAHVNTTINTSAETISSADYVPNTKVSVKITADQFPRGRSGFIDFMKSKLTILPEDSIRHELGVDEIWRRFQACFGPTDSMLSYEPVVRTFYQKLFESLVDDGINWVEIRSGGSSGKLVHTGQEDVDPDLDVWWEVMLDELDKFQATDKGKHFWGARVIWSDTRSKDREKITKSMKIALGRKQKFPELFSGYDLVAQEDLGRPLSDLAPELIWFQEQTQYLNLTIPFFFHAGETLGDGNSTDYNLVDAILFKSRRVGHGFSLYKHPKLIEEVIDNAVMVEVCPISNEVLRLATDILHHPLPAMIAHGVPTAISNDDPAILGQDIAGLSYDFYQTIQGFDNIGLAGLGALAQNSLRWSNFEDQSDADWLRDIDLAARGDGLKAQRMQHWNQQWEEFCQWIVSEYGKEYPVSAVAL
ncbi:adenosine deaminase family protein [Aspergillus clavatus NRRL 1]|uniref:adenosine deaminase n=1 Tax=Aspergillus clavatus (strain ATCC 1007 / CBS 513.65 / DSM 816 / NCTC 3887 / NRRL 1 / QM 1276 / 107) TaxID=344612 RepID=A1CLJ2_ASPCL|nr:adenosine deaminase family protein [Aspergillus clavatus NRRL 1]EAW10016.1 adenosine deaminase family protein [Aspergillus clavatus NRRL 1]